MKYLKAGIVLIFMILALPRDAFASIVTIKPDGEVLLNVLSEHDMALEIPKSESLNVSEVVGEVEGDNSTIALVRDGGKVKLTVGGKGSTRTLDVTDIDESVVEIEERSELEKISIKVRGDKFHLIQDNLMATTDYEIKVNPEVAGITLSTPSGFRFLSIFPKGAVETLLRAKVINRVNNSIVLNEGSDGVLSYEVSGERVIDIFGVYNYKVPVKARVSASTAEIISIEQPEWLSIISFLLV